MHANRHTRGQRWLAWVMAVVLCLGLLPGAALAAEEPTYTQVTSVDEIVEGGSFVLVAQTSAGAKALGTSISTKIDGADVTVEESTLTGSSIPVWTVESAAEGVSLSNGSEYLGYGSSGTNFTTPDTAYQWNISEEETGSFRFTASGNDTRAIAWQDEGGRFGAYSTANSSGYVFDLLVFKEADASQSGGEEGGETTTVAAPQATPQAGEVESGTKITLTCTTTGAEISYTLDGSDPTNSETRQEYSAENQPTITEDCTLKAVAVLGGVSSAVQTLEYTVKSESTAPIADGDQVVIYAPAYNKALSSEKTGYYNVGTDISVGADGAVTGYSDDDVWTVVANDDGTYSFQQDGQSIGLADRYASMDLGAVNDDWKLIDLGNGLYNIKNTVARQLHGVVHPVQQLEHLQLQQRCHR